ncbi:MerR family transcriptional regulator [Sphingomonas morindae]|uniref:MerR family transcriptional regulator n=1 Tax=Sphingomonas morindae TaxID=1541170 RepID=A0ABY4XDX8_9SPHN|nr:MerR family transcriptional regulator [Sphingomonas morindae]USI75063.1 MerR family transcriptional regulator [Sphingomonas morindae]
MTIGMLARAGEVTVETIRYYQRRGLLPTPAPAPGGGAVRRYGEQDARRLRFIRAAQAAGFRLDRIAELLALDATEDRARARQLAEEQLALLDARIAELSAARDALRQLADRCGHGGAGPCPILEAFDHAGAPQSSLAS